MTTPRGPLSERPILIGYVVLESWAEDYSDWDGVITGPVNPKGANLYWHNPIEMIEKRAYDAAIARAERAEVEAQFHRNQSDAFKKNFIEAEAQVAAMRGALGAIPARLEELAKTLRNGNGPEQTRIAEHDAILIAIGWLKSTTDRANIPASELGEAVQGVIEAVRLIAGPIEFYTATGERSQQAAAQAALSRLDAAMGKIT